MASGIRDQSALLAVVLPRVSPELGVVAAAAYGLVREIKGEPWRVLIESKRRDLVVEHRDTHERYWFEFKPLWSRGRGECLGGIEKDLEKVSQERNGYAVVFAYTVEKPPAGHDDRLTPGDLDSVVQKAVERLGRPVFSSSVVPIEGSGTLGAAQLLAWRGLNWTGRSVRRDLPRLPPPAGHCAVRPDAAGEQVSAAH